MATGNKRRSTNELALFPVQFPSGTVVPFAGATAPEGWALCDGSAVSRTTYASLYTAIGDAWGNGDGSTTFHLPDLRGRFLRGVDAAAGNDPDSASRTASNAGGNTGDNVGSVQDDAFKSHDHDLRFRNSAAGNTQIQNAQGFARTDNAGNNYGYNSFNTTNATLVENRGGNETRPINANVNYIIKL